MRSPRQTARSRNVVPGEKEPSRRMIWVELARTEILDATEQLLKRVPFSELNVTMVMAQTRLARSSFYEYFKDLHEVLVSLTGRMLEEMAAQNSVVDSRMPSAADRKGYLAALRDKYVIYCELHRKHRHLYRALVAAAPSDGRVEQLMQTYLESITQGTMENIWNVQKAGGARGLNVAETARAIILMSESYIMEKLCGKQRAHPEEVANVLLAILERVCFGELFHPNIPAGRG
jgi:TetR/AcrR family transcriptional regulator, ethionamide resistance regulator